MSSIDYDKYTYNGWGLSKECLQVLEKLIIEKSLTRVLEFGSGQSTYFLEDMGIEYVSFDDDLSYSAKCSNVLIRPLKQLSEERFNETVTSGYYDANVFNSLPIFTDKNPRQQNCFYEIKDGDLDGSFDLVILDGPNGNGRSIAFSAMRPFVSSNFYILIDDCTFYPFIEHFKGLYPNNKLYCSYDESYSHEYNIPLGYCIYEAQQTGGNNDVFVE